MSLSCEALQLLVQDLIGLELFDLELLGLDLPDLALLQHPLYKLKEDEFQGFNFCLGKRRLTVTIDPFIDSTTSGSRSKGDSL